MVVHAAEKKATAIGVPECIAVVDASGELLAFSRMDGARPGSIEIALTKARSAARRRRATGDEAGVDVLNGVRLALHAPDELRIVGMVDLRDDDTEEAAATQAQILGGTIRDVIAATGLGLHASLGADADIGRIAQRLRYCHHREV